MAHLAAGAGAAAMPVVESRGRGTSSSLGSSAGRCSAKAAVGDPAQPYILRLESKSICFSPNTCLALNFLSISSTSMNDRYTNKSSNAFRDTSISLRNHQRSGAEAAERGHGRGQHRPGPSAERCHAWRTDWSPPPTARPPRSSLSHERSPQHAPCPAPFMHQVNMHAGAPFMRNRGHCNKLFRAVRIS